MARTTHLLASLLLLASACSEPGAPPVPARDEGPRDATAGGTASELSTEDVPRAAAVVESPAAEPAATPLLVWGRDEEGLSYTWWVQPDGAGGFDVVGATGTIVAADGALWHWVVDEEPIAAELDCDLLEEIPGAGEGTGVRAFLDRIDGGERREVVVPNVDAAREANDYEEDAQLVGSIGPYLFVRRSAYSYHCGAHGGIEHEAFVWDVRSRQPVAVYAPDALESLDASMHAEAREQLAIESEGESLLFGDEVIRTMVRPVFDPTGAVRMEHQWTGGTCYACSDGEWDSYTVSTQLVIDALPQTLAPHVPDAGAAIRHLHESVEGLVVGGVSEADPAWREAFEALPVEGC